MSVQVEDLFKVDGMVAVITGGGTGIGQMMAKTLALNGASKVYIVGRRLEKLQETVKLSPHNNIFPLQGDVTSKDSLESLAARVRTEVGHVHLLVCNSGISGPQIAVNQPKDTSAKTLQKQAMETPMEDFTQTFAVNVAGVFYNAMAFLDLLEEGSKKRYNPGVTSQVIITGSIAAFNRSVGAGIAYNTSKAAVTHLMKMLAGLYTPYDVRVNIIAPGIFPSELSAPLMVGRDITNLPPDYMPIRRFGDEQDMGGTVLYLASRAGAYCSGLVLVIDGGRLTILPGTY